VSARDAERWVVGPGERFSFADRDPRATDGAPGGKKPTSAKLPKLARKLAGLQDRLYAESSQALLVVLQAMDAGGKDGTVKHVFGGVNPQGVSVTSFKVPTPEELAHDFLWRIHANVPRHGYIGIFNRSHYEDVLVARVHELVPEKVWRRRYGHINHFEALLNDAGVRVVKLCLHISREEQAERLQARLDDPTKRWKFNPGDLAERERWDDYLAAYEEAIRETSTEHAPWYVVPADRKWFRNWAVSRIVLETLADMDPQYPPPAEGLDGITVT
jgi:PPK2 family polyphosphate:nucleotide phosphotransferase